MKIEEAKEAIKASSKAMTDINAMHSFGHIPCKQAIPVNDVINIIDQIETDKPKPVVPQFVAEWLEECKHDRFYALHGAYAKMDDRLKCWRFGGGNSELFARAWLDGYEVEKEKLYTVKIPNPNGCNLYLIKLDKGVVITTGAIADVYPENLKLTEQEIRKDFDWAFRLAKEVTE